MTYYTDDKGADHVVQFATAGWWTGDIYCLLNNVSTLYTTRALSDAFSHVDATQDHREFLCRRQTRYLSFSDKFPTIEQYVPKKYIASYLGITPEFLSKLRKAKVKP